MPDKKISTLPALTGPGGSEIYPAVDSGSNVKITTSQLKTHFSKIMQPGYISGNWYCIQEDIPYNSGANGNVVAVTNTLFTPFIVWSSVIVSQLGGRVQTAGTNMKLGLYANNNSTMRPTGTCLGSTANITATGTGNVSAALSGGNITLNPGVYWVAYGSDNTALRILGVGSGLANAGVISNLIGSATQANVIGNSVSNGFSVTEAAYGTFGDMTSASFSSVATANLAWFFKVA